MEVLKGGPERKCICTIERGKCFSFWLLKTTDSELVTNEAGLKAMFCLSLCNKNHINLRIYLINKRRILKSSPKVFMVHGSGSRITIII